MASKTIWKCQKPRLTKKSSKPFHQTTSTTIYGELNYPRYSQAAIRLAPQNQSPWNYLKALLRKSGAPVSTIKEFTSEFASIKQPDNVRSSHALDLLAEILVEENAQEDASDALNLLAERYDPMRANYWAYRKSLLPQFGAAVSS